jgi:hypothetical protein
MWITQVVLTYLITLECLSSIAAATSVFTYSAVNAISSIATKIVVFAAAIYYVWN